MNYDTTLTLLDEQCSLCLGELNFVSREVEGILKEMAFDKFNSRWNCEINCKSIDGSVLICAHELAVI